MTSPVVAHEADNTVLSDLAFGLGTLPFVIEETHASRVRKARQSMSPLQLTELQPYETPKLQPQMRPALQKSGGLTQELHELCCNKNKPTNASPQLSASALDVLSRIPRGRGARGSRRSRSSSRSERPKAVPLLGGYVVGSFDTRHRKLRSLELKVEVLGSNGDMDFYKAPAPEYRLVAIQGSLFEPNPAMVSAHPGPSSTETDAATSQTDVETTSCNLSSHPLVDLSTDMALEIDTDSSSSACAAVKQQQAAIEQVDAAQPAMTQEQAAASQMAGLESASALVKADLGSAPWSTGSSSALFSHGLYCSSVLSSGCLAL